MQWNVLRDAVGTVELNQASANRKKGTATYQPIRIALLYPGKIQVIWLQQRYWEEGRHPAQISLVASPLQLFAK